MARHALAQAFLTGWFVLATNSLFNPVSESLPTGQVLEQGHLQSLQAGQHHTCVIVDNGSVRCWGRNDSGQLSLGHTQPLGDDEPITRYGYVHLDRRVIRLATGLEHSCAILEGGGVRCWGRNDFGQLGLGHTRPVGGSESPWLEHEVDVGGPAQEITAGGWHTCALLTNGKVRCWGRNDSGQLGLGHTYPIGDDGPPSGAGYANVGGGAIQLAAGLHHTCAVLKTGNVRCWGLNADGQLGLGHTSNLGDDEFPAAEDFVDVGAKVQQIVAGNSHTCALLTGGGIKCWGANTHGQLGLGDTTRRNAPSHTLVGIGDLPASQLAAGGWHTCAILTNGGLRCWGRNDSGQLGLGHTHSIGDDELPFTAGDVPVLTLHGLTHPSTYISAIPDTRR